MLKWKLELGLCLSQAIILTAVLKGIGLFSILPLTDVLSRWEIKAWISSDLRCRTELDGKLSLFKLCPFCYNKKQAVTVVLYKDLLLFVCGHCTLRVFAEVMSYRAWHTRIGER